MESNQQHLDNDYATLLNLVDNTQTFAGMLSLDGTLLFANAAPLKAMGIELRDVEGKKFWDCLWWSYDVQVQALIKKDYETAAAGTVTSREIQFLTTEGLRGTEYNSIPVFNDAGEVINVVVEGRSIGQRKQVEQALEVSQQEYKGFFEDVDEAFLLSDEHAFIECNMAAVRMLGYTKKEELKNKHLGSLSPENQPDGRDSFEKANEMIALAYKSARQRFEWTLRRSDGSPIDIEVLATPVQFGGKTSLHSVWRDLTVIKQQQTALQQSELRYRSLFDKPVDAFVLIENGLIIDANEAVLEMLGYDGVDELINVSPVDLSPPTQPDGSDSQTKGAEIAAECYKRDSKRFEWMHLRKNGEPILMEVLTTLIPVGDSLILHAIWRDITEVKRQEQALEDSELKYKSLFERSADATLLTLGDEIVDCNEAALKMLGYDNKEEMTKVHLGDLSPPFQLDGRDSHEKADEMTSITLDKGSNRFEWLHQRKNGDVIPSEVLQTAISIGGNVVLHNVWRDNTESKRQQQTLQHLAHHDSLTGLPNRVLFADRFKLAVAHSKRAQTSLAVCFIDIDNFKLISDNFGHSRGDKLLIEVARRMVACVREGDTVSRQGGDEFALILGGLESQQECEQLVGRMLRVLATPYVVDGVSHRITVSCGIALYSADDDDIDILVRHADHALYHAKLEGKNTYAFFNADTERSSRQRRAFLQRVSQAIDNEELVLHYQPKIDMRSGHMFGAEALIRWQHPDDGLIGPFGFLPKIGSTRVMVDVGNWVIEQALVQLSQWQKEGKDWVISINIDAYHFMQTDFVEHLKQALAKQPDVSAKQLEIEILETVAFNDLDHVSDVIHHCQALGVQFALDDFGTGYSSLVHLKGLPVQWIKIDQSFVHDMLADEQDLALIEGIVSLSKAFKREVIAEGVETVEHGSALLKLGCYNAQGYGIAKPMPAEKLPPWQESYQADNSWTRYSKVSLIDNEL
jgi:diguanylate cyclase (GGDEF)-like protein/PAS domain S-box-containing protein